MAAAAFEYEITHSLRQHHVDTLLRYPTLLHSTAAKLNSRGNRAIYRLRASQSDRLELPSRAAGGER